MQNLVKHIVQHGGEIKPLLVPALDSAGTGLLNPSVYNHNGKILVNIRHIDLIVYNSDKHVFPHQWGITVYPRLKYQKCTSTNFYAELDHKLDIKFVTKVDTTQFDTHEPKWHFCGLEDARLIGWQDKLYLSGVRRDTMPDGQGRMELSEIQVSNQQVREVSRLRLEPPHDQNSYCEKNWMPIVDKPYHYVKWSDPTEIVKANLVDGSTEQVTLTSYRGGHNDFRGGSHVLPYHDGYIALIHDVVTDNRENGIRYNIYRHRFVVWDNNWNLVKWSTEFSFLNTSIEFAAGMCQDPHNQDCWLISFGYQDNAAFVLRAPKQTITDFIEGKI